MGSWLPCEVLSGQGNCSDWYRLKALIVFSEGEVVASYFGSGTRPRGDTGYSFPSEFTVPKDGQMTIVAFTHLRNRQERNPITGRVTQEAYTSGRNFVATIGATISVSDYEILRVLE